MPKHAGIRSALGLALALPALAWGACIHLGQPVVCPSFPATFFDPALAGQPLPDGSMSIGFSGSNTTWQYPPNNFIVFISGTSFTPFIVGTPPPPVVGGQLPSTGRGILALTAGSTPEYEPAPRDDFFDAMFANFLSFPTNVGEDFDDKRKFLSRYVRKQERANEEAYDNWSRWDALYGDHSREEPAPYNDVLNPGYTTQHASLNVARIADDLVDSDEAVRQRAQQAYDELSSWHKVEVDKRIQSTRDYQRLQVIYSDLSSYKREQKERGKAAFDKLSDGDKRQIERFVAKDHTSADFDRSRRGNEAYTALPLDSSQRVAHAIHEKRVSEITFDLMSNDPATWRPAEQAFNALPQEDQEAIQSEIRDRWMRDAQLAADARNAAGDGLAAPVTAGDGAVDGELEDYLRNNQGWTEEQVREYMAQQVMTPEQLETQWQELEQSGGIR